MSGKLRPLAAVVIVALIAAGCSNAPAENTDSNTSGGTTEKATNRSKAAKFSACMRDNGVTKFPDPDASGELTIDGVLNGSSLNADSPTWKKAIAACKNLQPSGFTGHTRNAKEQASALKFAQCIRDHGVKDFPDPIKGEPLIDTNRIPSSQQPGGMTILNAAMQKCRSAAAKAIGDQ